MQSYHLDPSVRRTLGGRTLIGGSPFRLVTLTTAECSAIDRTIEGRGDPADRELVERLDEWGFLQPTAPDPLAVSASGRELLAAVDVVVPTRNRADSCADLVASLPVELLASVTVVDDGSDRPLVLDPGTASGVAVVRHDRSFGPGEARNAGVEIGTAPYLLFLDDDISFDQASGDAAETIGRLAALAEAWGLGAIAPRITSRGGSSLLERFESDRGGFDRGEAAGVVAPRTRIPFVPTGALLVRRDAFATVGGFRPGMRRGEDVDLVWRLHRAGRSVRYDPGATVSHPVSSGWRRWLRQRHDYGRSTAELGVHHPASVEALSISPWSVAVWALVLAGGPRRTVLGLTTLGGSVVLLAGELRGRVDDPMREATAIAGGGTVFAGSVIAAAVRRSWFPLAVVGACLRPSLRRAVIASLAALVLDWRRARPTLDPLRWCALVLADEVAYGSGVWRGALATGSFRALAVRWQSLDEVVVPPADLRGPDDRNRDRPGRPERVRRWHRRRPTRR